MGNRLLAPIPLVQALAWIVGSVFVVSGTAHFLLTRYGLPSWGAAARIDVNKTSGDVVRHPPRIAALIQTGPQKEALKTDCLAEWLGLSVDRPVEVSAFDLEQASSSLEKCPLIASVHLKLLKIGALVGEEGIGIWTSSQSQDRALYIDYTVRQPVAWLSDYENVALDREGYLFPFKPFFSPKNLPEIYLGLAPFGKEAFDEGKPVATWHQPLMGKYWEVASEVLSLLTSLKLQELFAVKSIDVSQAYAQSYGSREIVVVLEDKVTISRGYKENQYLFPKILRLSVKNYAAELGNYLKLREELVHKEHQEALAHFQKGSESFECKAKVLDFRIPNLAFINS